jgi:hypothetical protein
MKSSRSATHPPLNAELGTQLAVAKGAAKFALRAARSTRPLFTGGQSTGFLQDSAGYRYASWVYRPPIAPILFLSRKRKKLAAVTVPVAFQGTKFASD